MSDVTTRQVSVIGYDSLNQLHYVSLWLMEVITGRHIEERAIRARTHTRARAHRHTDRQTHTHTHRETHLSLIHI